MTNVTETPCSLSGYPSLKIAPAGGGAIPLTVNRQTPDSGYIYRFVKRATVVLRHEDTASSGIEWQNEEYRGQGTLEITPPNDHSMLPLAKPLGVPGNTVVTVTAVETGKVAGGWLGEFG